MEPRWFDAFWPLVAVGGFLGIAMAPDIILSAKQAVIVTSFVGLYFLGRIFFRTMYDLRQALPFFLLSSAVVAGYALWQNIRFAEGLESYQVMTGRPNALFPEADWLGMFLLLPLGIGLYLLTLLVWRGRVIGSSMNRALLYGGLLSFLILILTTLILTMARSAWLGAAMLVFSFGLFFLLRLKSETGRFFGHTSWLFSALLVGMLMVSVGIVESTRLSPFHLLNRIESTGGLQKITVACESVATPPVAIGTTDELAAYGCRHINLEDIECSDIVPCPPQPSLERLHAAFQRHVAFVSFNSHGGHPMPERDVVDRPWSGADDAFALPAFKYVPAALFFCKESEHRVSLHPPLSDCTTAVFLLPSAGHDDVPHSQAQARPRSAPQEQASRRVPDVGVQISGLPGRINRGGSGF
jgi:hypothetical protein